MRRPSLFASLLVAGCAAEWTVVTRVHSTPWDPEHAARVYCLPADREGDRFRCLKVSEGSAIKHARVWEVDARSGTIPFPLQPADSVTVILPPHASPPLRARAETLLRTCAAGRPGLAVHLLAGPGDLQEVRTGAQFEERIERWSPPRRVTQADRDLVWSGGGSPSPIDPAHPAILPLFGEAGRWLLVEPTEDAASPRVTTCSRDEALALSASLCVVLLLPADLPAETRLSCAALARERSRPGAACALRPTALRWEELATPERVATLAKLGRLPVYGLLLP